VCCGGEGKGTRRGQKGNFATSGGIGKVGVRGLQGGGGGKSETKSGENAHREKGRGGGKERRARG